MDESDFEIDRDKLVEGSRRFPAHRLTRPAGHPHADVSYLRRGADFGRHAWDEGGHS